MRHVAMGPDSTQQVVADIPGIGTLSGRRRALAIWREAFTRRIAADIAANAPPGRGDRASGVARRGRRLSWPRKPARNRRASGQRKRGWSTEMECSGPE